MDYVVKTGNKTNLREFVENLGNYEQMNAIVVEGHTDSSGSEAYNLELARQIADNGTAEGRAKNRHVELKVRAVRKTQ